MDQEKALAQRIQRARKAAKLSQEELGAQLGIEQSTVSLIETGVTEVSALRLVKIANILGRPVTWFLGIDTLADDEAEALHLYRQLESPALRENTLIILRAQVEADRQMREGRS